MELQINGERAELAPGTSLQAFLEQSQYNPTRIAVERNGEIVPKAGYARTVLAPGDTLEIVGFVGGG